jgi:transcriptional regulator with XRE-family HTH domain
LDCVDKAVPYGAPPACGWNVLADDLHFPLLVLKDTALAHNIRAMAEWCRRNGFLLAPHGKTTMCPQIYRRQLEAGAWAITVATASQAMVCVRAGVRRIMIANQVIGRASVASLAGAMNDIPDLEIYCLVDSVAAVRHLAGHLEATGTPRPVNALVEWGRPHWRTGARSLDELRRRLILKLLQRQVAEQLCVNEASIHNWETNRTKPGVHHMPAIIRFLGYNPLPPSEGWADRLVQGRIALGLTQKQAAARVGVDPCTLARWERGEREPKGAFAARAQRFLNATQVNWSPVAARTA